MLDLFLFKPSVGLQDCAALGNPPAAVDKSTPSLLAAHLSPVGNGVRKVPGGDLVGHTIFMTRNDHLHTISVPVNCVQITLQRNKCQDHKRKGCY